MRNAWQSLLLTLNDKQEAANMRNMIIMIFLFLGFIGAIFYVLIDSLA